jgi:hypothetical protein
MSQSWWAAVMLLSQQRPRGPDATERKSTPAAALISSIADCGAGCCHRPAPRWEDCEVQNVERDTHGARWQPQRRASGGREGIVARKMTPS